MKTFADIIREVNAGDEIRVVSSTPRWSERWPVGSVFTVESGLRPVADAKGARPGRYWSGDVRFEKVVASDPFVALKDMPFPEVAALIKAHNEGQTIKFRGFAGGTWFETDTPEWDGERQYAIALTPEQIREKELLALLEKYDAELSAKHGTLSSYNEESFWDEKFCELTRRQKGDLLLSAHNGASFQVRWEDMNWANLPDKPEFDGETYYRVTPPHVIELENEIAELSEKRNDTQNELNALRATTEETVSEPVSEMPVAFSGFVGSRVSVAFRDEVSAW